MNEGEEAAGGAATEVLPPLFARWMGDLLPGPIPAERHATCDRCAMLAPDAGGPGDAIGAGALFYSPSTKCCTYLPDLASFLVGAILSDPTDRDPAAAAGRATVEARIDAGVGVTPLGLERAPVYTLLYHKSPASFGHAQTMRCPHYLDAGGGRCGVWRHRESTCATWFCKHERGETGKAFWHQLHQTLRAAEEHVRLHCLLEVGGLELARAVLASGGPLAWPPQPDSTLSAADVDGRADPELGRARWGAWWGRERAFYAACAQVVAALRWADVVRIGGVRLEILSRVLVETHRQLTSDALPARVGRRHLTVIQTSSESVNLVGYSNLDPLRVPKKLADALHVFDGRPTEDALRSIEERHGLRVAPGVVRKLVDFGILGAVPPETPDER